MLPDFIIIGAMKSGTTSLYHYMNVHPQIGMSYLKETNFFIRERNLGKGVQWYENLFQGNFPCFGEASPNYSKAHIFPGVPREMHKLLPRVKLIYLVRDPVKRIASQYNHNYATGREPFDMAEAFANEQRFDLYLSCSKYYWQLQQYLMYFPAEQILVVSSERLKNDRKAAIKTIYQFLDVDDIFYSEKIENEFGTSTVLKRKGNITRFFLQSLLTFLKAICQSN